MARKFASFVTTISILLLIPTETAAICRAFSRTSAVFYTNATDQAQQVTNGTYCAPPPVNYTAPLIPPTSGYGSCATYVNGTPIYNLCVVQGRGAFTATGFMNISLSAADVAPIYQLINNQSWINTTFPDQSYNNTSYDYDIGFYQSYTGCQSPYQNAICIAAGTAGYGLLTPGLKCVNGTLEACENGPVDSGTPISICGVGVYQWSTLPQGGSDYAYFPASYRLEFVDTSVAEALNGTYKDDPAYNATCARIYQQSSGGWRIGFSGVAVLVGFVVAVLVGSGVDLM